MRWLSYTAMACYFAWACALAYWLFQSWRIRDLVFLTFMLSLAFWYELGKVHRMELEEYDARLAAWRQRQEQDTIGKP